VTKTIFSYVLAGIVMFAALFLGFTEVQAASGIRGRVAWRGQLISGVTVYAFTDDETDNSTAAEARSKPTGADGTYLIDLRPGSYTLIARTGEADDGNHPSPGEYYCYYSGSPVVVQPESWIPVGFNLVKVPEEVRKPDGKASISGTVTYMGDPLEKLYLYLYRDPSGGFRGPGIATVPVGSEGRFRVTVSPGSYYIIARKRLRGGMYGPMEIGDYFNYYPGNPVTVREEESVILELETVTRISQLEEGEISIPSVAGVILDAGGKPVAGVRVLAYRPEEIKGRPIYFSEPSDSDGMFLLPVPVTGDYSLVARERFGGPAKQNEFYGIFSDGMPVTIGRSGSDEVLKITVRRKR